MVVNPDVAPRRTLRGIHIAWAALAIIACGTLALVPQVGHPPPVALVPVVLVLWLIGHAVIWALAWLNQRGRRSISLHGARPRRWPLALLAALMGTGAVAIAGLLQLLGSALQQRLYPYPDLMLWLVCLLVCAVHTVCLVGLLLRKPSSRTLSAALALGWAGLLAAQIFEHRASLARITAADNVLAIGLLALLLALAVNLLTSRSVRLFYEG